MKTNEELEQDILAVTSRLTYLDQIIKARGLGLEMEPVFRCGASGLYYPSDYVKNWGILYGIGLGPDVCSESLQTEYGSNPPEITPDTRSIEEIMHPVVSSKAQMDWDLVTVSDSANPEHRYANFAILEQKDRHCHQRAKILRAKQLKNPRGKLALAQIVWERMHREIH